MALSAIAKSDSNGRASFGGGRLGSDSLNGQSSSTVTQRTSIWEPEINYEGAILSDLLEARETRFEKFNRLARRLVDTEGHDPGAKVQIGRTAGIVAIIVGNTEYRQRGFGYEICPV